MKKKEFLKKIAVEVSRFLLGITFIFSGFVKAVDPLGNTYKIEDYMISFGCEAFLPLALFLSIAMCVVEFSVGVFMLLGIYRKWTTRLVLLIMSFMTLLTLYLAIANPVSDCGCFGDALIITNWQTFYKNIVLLVASIITFLYYSKIQNFFTGKFYWLVALFIIAFGMFFSIYNYSNEPILDFRPYKIGANLRQLMSVEDGKGGVYENIFIYEKDGVKEEFDENNYPWQDASWVFVDRINKLIKEGEKSVIHDFKINKLQFNSDKANFEYEEDITEEILNDDNYVFLMISYSLSEMNDIFFAKFEDVKNYADDHNYKFYCVTASTKEDIIKWEKEKIDDFEYCLNDERTIKTMMRSNPGLMLLKNGIVVNKWTGKRVPNENELIKPLDELPFGQTVDVKAEDKKNIFWIVVFFTLPLLIIKILDFLLYRKRRSAKDIENKAKE